MPGELFTITQPEEPATLYPPLETVLGVILCCVFVTAVIGNTFTFLVVTRMNSWNNSAILFITHLGLVDILNSLVITPFSAVALFKGRQSEDRYSAKYQWLCDINGFMFILIRVLVPLTNLNIAIDRAIAITLPLKYTKIMNIFSVIFILCCDWLIALGFASGTYMINRHFVEQHEVAETYFVYNEYTTLCYPNLRLDDHYMIFQTCLSVSIVIIPFVAIFILSMVVISLLNLQENKRIPGNAITNMTNGNRSCTDEIRTYQTDKNVKADKRTKRTRKATQTLMIVVVLYLAFWLPYVILWILDVTHIWTLAFGQTLQLYLVTAATICIICNSATNPLVFIIRSEKYRSIICKSAGEVKQKIVTVKEELSGSFNQSPKRDAYAVKDSDQSDCQYIDNEHKPKETFL
ncbi:hypothetical protein ACHWQZ_G016390 [Mnemiopsis leidyi]